MRVLVRTLFFLVVLHLALFSQAGPFLLELGAEELPSGVVIHVKDGDTIVMAPDVGEAITVRLYGVDSPESLWEDRWEAQPYGAEAKAFTKALVLNKRVSVRLTGDVTEQRVVGELFIEDKILNRELLKHGLAWWYKDFAPEDEALKKLEEEARAGKVGLWQDPDPVPPWEHRHKGD